MNILLAVSFVLCKQTINELIKDGGFQVDQLKSIDKPGDCKNCETFGILLVPKDSNTKKNEAVEEEIKANEEELEDAKAMRRKAEERIEAARKNLSLALKNKEKEVKMDALPVVITETRKPRIQKCKKKYIKEICVEDAQSVEN